MPCLLEGLQCTRQSLQPSTPGRRLHCISLCNSQPAVRVSIASSSLPPTLSSPPPPRLFSRPALRCRGLRRSALHHRALCCCACCRRTAHRRTPTESPASVMERPFMLIRPTHIAARWASVAKSLLHSLREESGLWLFTMSVLASKTFVRAQQNAADLCWTAHVTKLLGHLESQVSEKRRGLFTEGVRCEVDGGNRIFESEKRWGCRVGPPLFPNYTGKVANIRREARGCVRVEVRREIDCGRDGVSALLPASAAKTDVLSASTPM